MHARSCLWSVIAATASAAFVPAQRFEWREVSTLTRPPARADYAMVWDHARGVVLLFGGLAGTTYLNDTWSFDGTNWRRLLPVTNPTPRALHAMAYDPLRERVVMIGGETIGGVVLSDTWEWDGVNWTQRAGSTVGIGRRGAACFDPTQGGVFFDLVSTHMLWDGSIWRYLGAAGSTILSNHQIVFDPVAGALVSSRGSELYRFSPSAGWISMSRWGAFGRTEYAMANDPFTGRIVLSCGNGSSGSGSGDRFGDTWIWNGSAWTQLEQRLSQRRRNRMVFDLVRRRFILFGGDGENGFPLNDTWELHTIDVLAEHRSYGQGCGVPAARFAPDPYFGGRPFVGGSLTMLGTGLLPSQPVVQCIGYSDAQWGSITLPFDLAPIGAPGCPLLASPDALEARGLADASGTLRFTFRIPDQLGLAGVRFFHQLVGLAPGLNPASLIVSDAGAATIGTR